MDERDDDDRFCRWFCWADEPEEEDEEDPGFPWLALMVTLGVGCCLLELIEGELEPRVIDIESFPISRLAPCGDASEEDDPPPPDEEDFCLEDELPGLALPLLPVPPSPASMPRLAS